MNFFGGKTASHNGNLMLDISEVKVIFYLIFYQEPKGPLIQSLPVIYSLEPQDLLSNKKDIILSNNLLKNVYQILRYH